MCVQLVPLGTSNNQVHESWERNHIGYANICEVYVRTDIFQMKGSWEQYDKHFVDIL